MAFGCTVKRQTRDIPLARLLFDEMPVRKQKITAILAYVSLNLFSYLFALRMNASGGKKSNTFRRLGLCDPLQWSAAPMVLWLWPSMAHVKLGLVTEVGLSLPLTTDCPLHDYCHIFSYSVLCQYILCHLSTHKKVESV